MFVYTIYIEKLLFSKVNALAQTNPLLSMNLSHVNDTNKSFLMKLLIQGNCHPTMPPNYDAVRTEELHTSTVSTKPASINLQENLLLVSDPKSIL